MLLKHLNNPTDLNLEKKIHLCHASASEMIHLKSNAN